MAGDHKCPVCQATFTRPQHVARHMRSRKHLLPYPLRGSTSLLSLLLHPSYLLTPLSPDTGDRPYKCQHCGDQFARRFVYPLIIHLFFFFFSAFFFLPSSLLTTTSVSDLLSRHINKCHPNEKPLLSSAPSRRKGSSSASRATTSKQACDQCVQSSLPCDGANPCCQ